MDVLRRDRMRGRGAESKNALTSRMALIIGQLTILNYVLCTTGAKLARSGTNSPGVDPRLGHEPFSCRDLRNAAAELSAKTNRCWNCIPATEKLCPLI